MATRRHTKRPGPPGGGSPNPADSTVFRRQLHHHVEALAATVQFRGSHTRPATDRDARQRREQNAAAWVYQSCLVAWAEDHGLVRPLLRASPDGLTRTPASGLLWLARAFEQLAVHPSTQWLMHPGYQPLLWAGAPSPAACTALIDWWAAEAPSLAYPATSGYPPSITGWPIGDLLGVLSPDRRARHALVQTPHFVAELILDQTLIPAADTFRDQRLIRTIDPACGTGHFLIVAADYLWHWWTTGTLTPHAVTHRPPLTGGTARPPAEAIRRILASVDGVEIDPLTAAVGRLRMTVYVGHLLVQAGLHPGPLCLHTIPGWVTPRIAVGDSLLLGQISQAEYARLHPDLAVLPGAAFPLPDFTWPPDTPAPAPAAPSRRARRTR